MTPSMEHSEDEPCGKCGRRHPFTTADGCHKCVPSEEFEVLDR